MEYVEPKEAKDLPGLRLALTVGGPAPYGMSARTIFDLKGIDYVPVAQHAARDNTDLVAWTKHRNAPIAVYNDEAPRTGWLEILNLAERLSASPPLVPANMDERMRMIGLVNELIGENGLIWNLRIILFGLGGPERAAEQAKVNPMLDQYGYSEAALTAAYSTAGDILTMFAGHLHRQRDAGSPYVIGQSMTAADVYWVHFSQLLKPLPESLCPMPAGLRTTYSRCGEAVAPYDDILLEQRDWVVEHHLPNVMDF